MSVVMSATLSESLQTLVDSRLDTVERMLLGRVGRQERLAIVREVESQIHDLLADRGGDPDELTREDVLEVLARLDPPEAYLPEIEDSPGRGPGVMIVRPRSVAARPPARDLSHDRRIALTSGILGLISVAALLLIPVLYLVATVVESEVVLIGGFFAATALMFFGGVVALALGIYGRRGGAWAVVGMASSPVSILFGIVSGMYLLLMLANM